jgi:hypothetical protein
MFNRLAALNPSELIDFDDVGVVLALLELPRRHPSGRGEVKRQAHETPPKPHEPSSK